jgi:hypothetical protein
MSASVKGDQAGKAGVLRGVRDRRGISGVGGRFAGELGESQQAAGRHHQHGESPGEPESDVREERGTGGDAGEHEHETRGGDPVDHPQWSIESSHASIVGRPFPPFDTARRRDDADEWMNG